MKKFTDVHAAYWFLENHPVRGWANTSFTDVLDITVMKVNPRTGKIDNDTSKNTSIEVWLESGPGYSEGEIDEANVALHDPDLDTGGATFEEALIRLAGRVKRKYG